MIIRLSLISLMASLTFANLDGAYLSRPFQNLVHPKVDTNNDKNRITKSDTQSVVKNMSSVKSQGSRGTCSIFSAAAMLEGLLAIQGITTNQIDLSEEWLQYLNIASSRSTTDGSFTSRNFKLIRSFGMPLERTLPYDSSNWEKSTSVTETNRCQNLATSEYKMCELGHFNPNFYRMNSQTIINLPGGDVYVNAKEEAAKVKASIPSLSPRYSMYSVSEIKERLQQGLPVILDINFFYGAWNHRKADEYGIGRDLDQWSKGIVGYPEYRSIDYKKSMENRAGHSVLLVGYDDDKEVTTTVKMQDGTVKTFTYKGVYFFKNSWGTGSFGSSAEIDGNTEPGYGLITQKYSHEHGSFYKLDFN